MAVRELPDGRWSVVYRRPGQKNPTSEYFGRGQDAQDAAEERDLEIKLAKKRGLLKPRTEAVYLDSLAQSYLKDAKLRGRSQRHLDEYSHILNTKVLPSLCYKPVDQLTYDEVIEFVSVTWGRLSIATRQRQIAYMQSIFRFGIRHKITTNNPLSGWSNQKEPKRDFRLTVQDLQKLMDVAPPHLAWALEVEWELGTRPGVTELFDLRWDDVDFEAATIRVRGTKTATSDRIMPLTPPFVDRLRERQKTARSGYLIEYAGRPIKSIRRGLDLAALRAGLAYKVRPYDLRHLFASVMLAGGGDLAAVSKLLGHATINTTMGTYYHAMQGEKARATALRPVIKKRPVSQDVRQNKKAPVHPAENIDK